MNICYEIAVNELTQVKTNEKIKEIFQVLGNQENQIFPKLFGSLQFSQKPLDIFVALSNGMIINQD